MSDPDVDGTGLPVAGRAQQEPHVSHEDEDDPLCSTKTYPLPVLLLAVVYEEVLSKPIKPGEVPHFNALAAVRDAVAAEFAEAHAQKLPCESAANPDGADDAIRAIENGRAEGDFERAVPGYVAREAPDLVP